MYLFHGWHRMHDRTKRASFPSLHRCSRICAVAADNQPCTAESAWGMVGHASNIALQSDILRRMLTG